MALLLGCGLLALGAPRFVAGLSLAPHDTMLRVLRQYPDSVGSDQLALAIDAYEEAVDWAPDSRVVGELARFNYILAQRFGVTSDLGRRHLVAALERATEAISLSPSSPFAWTYRALTLYLLQGMSPSTIVALSMAIDTAPYQPQLLQPRIGLGLVAWTRLDEELRRKLADQIRFAAIYMPAELAALLGNPSHYRLVRQILADRPDLLQALEAEKT